MSSCGERSGNDDHLGALCGAGGCRRIGQCHGRVLCTDHLALATTLTTTAAFYQCKVASLRDWLPVLWHVIVIDAEPTVSRVVELSLARSAAEPEFSIVCIIIGQAHFVKTMEDQREALIGASPHLKFGLAYCEAPGPRLVRDSAAAAQHRLPAVPRTVSVDIMCQMIEVRQS